MSYNLLLIHSFSSLNFQLIKNNEVVFVPSLLLLIIIPTHGKGTEHDSMGIKMSGNKNVVVMFAIVLFFLFIIKS